MRIVFIGAVEFSEQALKTLIQIGSLPVAVLTKRKSSFNADFRDISFLAEQNNIPCKHVIDINHPANTSWIRSYNPDVIFCFGWSSLIKQEILDIPRLGVIGYHPALLPKNRGRHPIIWALALGLSETGSTFFFMDTGADTGDILSQEKIMISEEDNARTLYDKVLNTALGQIVAFVPKLAHGVYDRLPQQPDAGNSWRKRSKSDGAIDFRMSAEQINNLTRALHKPYVGAHISAGSAEWVIWKTSDGGNAPDNIEPGKVLEVKDNTFRVKCANGSVWILEHEIEGLPEAGSYLI